MDPDLLGKILLGQYRVDQHIASTNMSDVYRVWDLHRNVPLAMKVLNADLAEDPSMSKRFRREAQALKKLRHPHIVPFYGLFEAHDLYFLLEAFIDGPSLRDILRQLPDRRMSVADALVYLKAVCAALGYAHANGVVHCDIKPGNVMVDQGGAIYLTDFGIARHADSSTTTVAGAGTTAYMAPEQITEEVVSASTDVYALGVMLYEMLVGRRPFRGDDEALNSLGRSTNERLRYAHLSVPPPDPRKFRADLPDQLAIVILKALDKNPERRQATASEFFVAICAAASVAENQVKDRTSPTTSAPPPEPPGRTSSLRPRALVWIGGAAVMIILAVWLFIKFADHGAELTSIVDLMVWKISPEVETPTKVTKLPSLSPASTYTAVPSEAPTPSPAAVATPVPVFDDGAELILIPFGEFTMGLTQQQISSLCSLGEGCDRELLSYSVPDHKVYLSDYWIYRTEVTNAQYAQCVDAGECSPPHESSQYKVDSYFGNPRYDQYPVVHVDWYQADQYCRAAGGRLPTEAEWEKAARGVNGRLWPWGNEPPQNRHANLSDTNLTTIDGTTAVGRFSPDGDSPYGLVDMAGNVYEWVSDWYSYTYYRESPYEDPQGPSQSSRYNKGNPAKVVKGGSSGYDSWVAASGVHDLFEPANDGWSVGFRCVHAGP